MKADAGQARERRVHRRVSVRLPLECRPRGAPAGRAMRGLTTNVSAGGIYFETELNNSDAKHGAGPGGGGGALWEMELTVPPGDGHFPYEGRVSAVFEEVRREDLGGAGKSVGWQRVGIGGRFHAPLKLSF